MSINTEPSQSKMSTIVLREFPLHRPDFDAPLFYSQFWRKNMIIHAASREVEYAEHAAPLSIKCAFNGQEFYEYGVGRCAVDDRSYLVLNEAQSYSSYIQSDTEVESFSLFFRPGLAEEVLATLITPADQLLDNPQEGRTQPTLFFEKLYAHDAAVSPLLLELRRAVLEGDLNQEWLEESFHILLERILQVHRNVYSELEKLTALRVATRAELYRRLARAKDFMDSSFQRPLSLKEIAGVACLSTHHFLRLFKQVFKETPHQHLTLRRLEEARRLLCETEQTVTQICLSVGFENASSFSRLFRRRYGLAPKAFRHQPASRKKATSA